MHRFIRMPSADFGGSVNPFFFASFPTLQYDTWWTIGAQPGDADGLNNAFDPALTSYADWNNGGDFVANTFIGGSIFIVPGANGQGNPINGRVLLGQVTTAGTTDAVVNLEFRDVNQETFYASGMTLTFPNAGNCPTDWFSNSDCTTHLAIEAQLSGQVAADTSVEASGSLNALYITLDWTNTAGDGSWAGDVLIELSAPDGSCIGIGGYDVGADCSLTPWPGHRNGTSRLQELTPTWLT